MTGSFFTSTSYMGSETSAEELKNSESVGPKREIQTYTSQPRTIGKAIHLNT
jgi:hypothetical protein